MANESAVWQAAENLIARFGDAAVEQAELRARELCESHNAEAGSFWAAVKRATEVLLRSGPDRSLH